MRKIPSLIALLVLVSLLPVGGASAAWTYSGTTVDDVSSSLHITVSDFAWQGSEILPDEEELENNPRSRSAKLRVCEKL